jgi:hypothetical protein
LLPSFLEDTCQMRGGGYMSYERRRICFHLS